MSEKLGYNRFMVESVWVVGRKRLLEDDIRKKRISALVRRQKRESVHRSVATFVTDRKEKNMRDLKRDKKYPQPPWVAQVREKFPHWFK